jgi:hypothetical protein
MKVLTREELIKRDPILQALEEGNSEMYLILKTMEHDAKIRMAKEDVENQKLMDELAEKIKKEELCILS